MTVRSRWVVVRDGPRGKRWQLVFPDGRVLADLPALPPDGRDGRAPPREDSDRPDASRSNR